jgi:hypothetical protein
MKTKSYNMDALLKRLHTNGFFSESLFLSDRGDELDTIAVGVKYMSKNLNLQQGKTK